MSTALLRWPSILFREFTTLRNNLLSSFHLPFTSLHAVTAAELAREPSHYRPFARVYYEYYPMRRRNP
jgi:hypothetical protein